MTVGLVEIRVFGECRGRQDDVGIAGGICEKPLVNDSKQIFPGEPGVDLGLQGSGGGRVGSVDIEKSDRRILPVAQGRSDVGHVQAAWLSLEPVGAVDGVELELKLGAGVVLDAAAERLVGAREPGQGADGPNRPAAAGASADSNSHLDERGAGAGKFPGQALDVFLRQAGELRRPGRLEARQHLSAQALEAGG